MIQKSSAVAAALDADESKALRWSSQATSKMWTGVKSKVGKRESSFANGAARESRASFSVLLLHFAVAFVSVRHNTFPLLSSNFKFVCPYKRGILNRVRNSFNRNLRYVDAKGASKNGREDFEISNDATEYRNEISPLSRHLRVSRIASGIPRQCHGLIPCRFTQSRRTTLDVSDIIRCDHRKLVPPAEPSDPLLSPSPPSLSLSHPSRRGSPSRSFPSRPCNPLNR